MQRSLSLLFLAVALTLSPLGFRPGTATASDLRHSASLAASLEPTDAELALFTLANQDRAQAGLPALRFDFESLAVARARASAQHSEGSLSHFDAAGKMVFADMLGDSGIAFQLAGENLARISGPMSAAPQRAEVSLMNSPTHRANILEPEFDLLAVGMSVDAQGRVVFAQVFRAT